jgi:hypothetical protein
MTRPFTTIAALLFALAVLVHIYRLFRGAQIVVGSHTIPMWCSYVAIVIAAVLAWGLYRESKS